MSLNMTPKDWQRFWSAVVPSEGCQLWKPHLTGKPKFCKGDESFTPSVIAYKDSGRIVPEGWYLTRTCRNKRCIDPEHAMPRHCTRTETTEGEYRAHFWTKVDKDGSIPAHVPHLGKCWTWTEGLFSTGYGQFWYRGTSRNAHRMAYIFEVGEIPEGKVIDHKCHNEICVRPNHLRPLEVWENAANRGPGVYVGVTGYRGVNGSWSKFKAEVKFRGTYNYLGTFDTAEEANDVAVAFRREHLPTSILDQEVVLA